MITKENCKKLENGKVIMDFAVFQELANAKIESLKAGISNNELQIEINNLKMEISEYKCQIKQLITEIVKASDMENNQFYKDNAMPIPLYPEIPEKRMMEGKCIVKPIGGRTDGE